MSTHRELKNAQQALNEAVAPLRDELIRLRAHSLSETWALSIGVQSDILRGIFDAYNAWDALRKQFDGDRPAVARDTSIAAAKTNPPSAGTLRRRVVQAIVARFKLYQAGMTTDELEVLFKRSHQSVSSAVSDMESKGWIRDSGERRVTRSRCKAIVYKPTDLALTMIEAGG